MSVFLAAGMSQDMVKNGGFEDSLKFWTAANSGGTWSITRDTTYQADPDYEVQAYQSMASWTTLEQTVNLPGPLVRFSAWARLVPSTAGGAGYYAYGALVLKYMDSTGTALGSTMICRGVAYAPQSTSTLHVITAASANWESYSFLLWDELTNLPDIDPFKVAKVSIRLEAAGNGKTG